MLCIKVILFLLKKINYKNSVIECLVHFPQLIWRQYQNKRLATKYRGDEYFLLTIKKLIALAFISPSIVATVFDQVAEEFDDDDHFLAYFEKSWIGELRKRSHFLFHHNLVSCFLFLEVGRKKPQFEHELWNTYDRVIAGIPRCNNSVEGWHNAFASRVSINHPNIIRFVEKIYREQSKFEADIAKISQSHQVKVKKNCYRRLDERITRLMNAYDSPQLAQHLTNIASNISS